MKRHVPRTCYVECKIFCMTEAIALTRYRASRCANTSAVHTIASSSMSTLLRS
jgi:hypothetical protein